MCFSLPPPKYPFPMLRLPRCTPPFTTKPFLSTPNHQWQILFQHCTLQHAWLHSRFVCIAMYFRRYSCRFKKHLFHYQRQDSYSAIDQVGRGNFLYNITPLHKRVTHSLIPGTRNIIQLTLHPDAKDCRTEWTCCPTWTHQPSHHQCGANYNTDWSHP